jgi:hypothetical protein
MLVVVVGGCWWWWWEDAVGGGGRGGVQWREVKEVRGSVPYTSDYDYDWDNDNDYSLRQGASHTAALEL